MENYEDSKDSKKKRDKRNKDTAIGWLKLAEIGSKMLSCRFLPRARMGAREREREREIRPNCPWGLWFGGRRAVGGGNEGLWEEAVFVSSAVSVNKQANTSCWVW